MSEVYHQEVFVKDLVSALKELHFQEGVTPSTADLNKAVTKVAIKYGLSVWAKHLDESENPDRDNSHISGHEWLYDLFCYRFESEHYALSDTVLVMESEWWDKHKSPKGNDGGDQYGEVKFDFQKLLVSNADIKLMVYRHQDGCVGNDADLEQYFRRRRDNYRQGRATDLFLFARYSDKTYTEGQCSVCSYSKARGWKKL